MIEPLARPVPFQPSPTAKAVEWAKATEYYPDELFDLQSRHGDACCEEELQIFAFINTVSTFEMECLFHSAKVVYCWIVS